MGLNSLFSKLFPVDDKLPDGFEYTPVLRGTQLIAPLLDLVRVNGGIICGGYARYCASQSVDPASSSNIDIFVLHFDSFDCIANALVKLGLQEIGDTPSAKTFRCTDKSNSLLSLFPDVQLIKPRDSKSAITYGLPTDIVGSFDFTVATAFLKNESVAVVDKRFHRDEKAKKLVIKNIVCPVSTLYRIGKYIRKGYRISLFEYIKLLEYWVGMSNSKKSSLISMIDESSSLTEEEVGLAYAMAFVD